MDGRINESDMMVVGCVSEMWQENAFLQKEKIGSLSPIFVLTPFPKGLEGN